MGYTDSVGSQDCDPELQTRKGENEMKKALMTVLAICLVVSLTACAASKQKKVEQEMKQPIS